jgi:hypothetical protein
VAFDDLEAVAVDEEEPAVVSRGHRVALVEDLDARPPEQAGLVGADRPHHRAAARVDGEDAVGGGVRRKRQAAGEAADGEGRLGHAVRPGRCLRLNGAAVARLQACAVIGVQRLEECRARIGDGRCAGQG